MRGFQTKMVFTRLCWWSTGERGGPGIAWSMSCYDALKANGVKTEMYRIDGAGHLLAAMNPEALDRACTFLQAALQGENEKDSPTETVLPAAQERAAGRQPSE